MTKKEYERLHRLAKKRFPKMTRRAMTDLRRIYKKAADLAAQEVRRAVKAGAADLTIQSWAAIEDQLEQGARNISRELDGKIRSTVTGAAAETGKIHEDYLIDMIDDVGATSRITKAGVSNLFFRVNEDVVRAMVSRVYQNGYSYSDTIWRAGRHYQKTIKDVISTGLAQGRDLTKVARDVQVYTRDGKVALANRLGPTLKRPAWEFMKRVGNKVDYRALRLVRSELYSSLQMASLQQGKKNPGCTDMYDWIMEAGREHWGCGCPGLARGGPYTREHVPGYPHPNCRCRVQPVLRDGREFKADLKRWMNGENVDYMDDWYIQEYQYAA